MASPQKLIDELYEISNNYFKQVGFINEDLDSRTQTRNMADARLIYSNILRTNTVFSTTEIGKSIKRDHSTIIHSCKNKSIIFSNKHLAKMLIELQTLILSKLTVFKDPYIEKEKEMIINLMHCCL